MSDRRRAVSDEEIEAFRADLESLLNRHRMEMDIGVYDVCFSPVDESRPPIVVTVERETWAGPEYLSASAK